MSIRPLYLAAGAAWGVRRAVLVGLAGYVFTFGISWLNTFGFDTWPPATDGGLTALAIVASLAAIPAMAAAALYYCRRAEASGTDQGQARRARFGVLGLSAAIGVAIVVVVTVKLEDGVADGQSAGAQDAAMATLGASRHTIDRIKFFGWNADTGSAGIVLRGNRSGDYQVSWQVAEPTHGRVLAEGRELVTLGPGRRTVVIALGKSSLIESYREQVMPGVANATVNQAFRLTAAIEPVPDPAERASLPPQELQNLANGDSALRSVGVADVPMSFQATGGPAHPTE